MKTPQGYMFEKRPLRYDQIKSRFPVLSVTLYLEIAWICHVDYPASFLSVLKLDSLLYAILPSDTCLFPHLKASLSRDSGADVTLCANPEGERSVDWASYTVSPHLNTRNSLVPNPRRLQYYSSAVYYGVKGHDFGDHFLVYLDPVDSRPLLRRQAIWCKTIPNIHLTKIMWDFGRNITKRTVLIKSSRHLSSMFHTGYVHSKGKTSTMSTEMFSGSMNSLV